jgi:hypothetical protein
LKVKVEFKAFDNSQINISNLILGMFNYNYYENDDLIDESVNKLNF